MKPAGEICSSGVAVTLVMHEHERLGRGIEFTALAAMSGMERYIRDRTLEGHESARKHGKTIGGAGVTDADMLAMALHLRDQEMSLRDITKRLVITTGVKRGRHPTPATVMRMLREHDEQADTAAST
ncbi:hypothetical protein [Streptomyces sp. NPDC048385]|uniref:hypothetical protein n=1 Tax=unclassified Streptomyces TaxID=2593676 RepID=UPI0034448FAD